MRLRALAIAASAALVAAPSFAATTAPMSAIPTIPRLSQAKDAKTVDAAPGVVVKNAPPYAGARFFELDAATTRGYCFVAREHTLRLQKTIDSRDPAELWHLAETDGKATLERMLYSVDFESKKSRLTGRVSVELREIMRSASGVVVWAFREGAEIILLASGAEGGLESPKERQGDEEPPSLAFVSSECTFGAVRLDARKPEVGAVAQLTGTLPPKGEGKDKIVLRFTVDASLSRVARDPEARLAVRVRVND